MRRLILPLAFAAATLWAEPSLAQSRAQLGPLCTSEGTPADQQIDACNEIIALKAFSGEQLAAVYFWRAVGWNKKGDYVRVIADTTEALRLKPNQALYNMRGSAYYDKGEYDIAIADFNDALRIGPPSGIILHNRGNALRSGPHQHLDVRRLPQQSARAARRFHCAQPRHRSRIGPRGAGRARRRLNAGRGDTDRVRDRAGKVALDGQGDNSPFSAAVSRHIGTAGLEVQQMLTRVRAEVVAATGGKQVPWSNSSLLGEVYLAAK